MNRKIWRSREGGGVSVHMYTHIHFIAFVPGIVWLCGCMYVYMYTICCWCYPGYIGTRCRLFGYDQLLIIVVWLLPGYVLPVVISLLVVGCVVLVAAGCWLWLRPG